VGNLLGEKMAALDDAAMDAKIRPGGAAPADEATAEAAVARVEEAVQSRSIFDHAKRHVQRLSAFATDLGGRAQVRLRQDIDTLSGAWQEHLKGIARAELQDAVRRRRFSTLLTFCAGGFDAVAHPTYLPDASTTIPGDVVRGADAWRARARDASDELLQSKNADFGRFISLFGFGLEDAVPSLTLRRPTPALPRSSTAWGLGLLRAPAGSDAETEAAWDAHDGLPEIVVYDVVAAALGDKVSPPADPQSAARTADARAADTRTADARTVDTRTADTVASLLTAKGSRLGLLSVSEATEAIARDRAEEADPLPTSVPAERARPRAVRIAFVRWIGQLDGPGAWTDAGGAPAVSARQLRAALALAAAGFDAVIGAGGSAGAQAFHWIEDTPVLFNLGAFVRTTSSVVSGRPSSLHGARTTAESGRATPASEDPVPGTSEGGGRTETISLVARIHAGSKGLEAVDVHCAARAAQDGALRPCNSSKATEAFERLGLRSTQPGRNGDKAVSLMGVNAPALTLDEVKLYRASGEFGWFEESTVARLSLV
jgi:hypothetical protein